MHSQDFDETRCSLILVLTGQLYITSSCGSYEQLSKERGFLGIYKANAQMSLHIFSVSFDSVSKRVIKSDSKDARTMWAFYLEPCNELHAG